MIKENYRLTLNKRFGGIDLVPTERIMAILESCDANPDLHIVRDVVRVIANTGISNSEFGSLRMSNIDTEQQLLFAGQGRASKHAMRTLPLRPRTLDSLMSLHRMNPESDFVLGDHPRTRFDNVLAKIRSVGPELSRGRVVMHSVRMNFASRLYSTGIPLSIVKYCVGQQASELLMSRLSLTDQQKREIVKRDLENFLPEL